MQPGEIRRIARTISTVEDRADGHEEILARAYRLPRWAEVIGITGPPGAGKSTLVDTLTAHWAKRGERIAILAIDPASPYSGGAVLGDRIRRNRSISYDNIYFRSLSARGHVGGLNETAADLVAVLSLFDFRRVIIETVGAGQADIEVHDTADCTVVLTVPGLGDGVQAAKAGLMEIGDVFAINKADMAGADETARLIGNALAAVYMGEPGVNLRANRKQAAPARPENSPGTVALRRRHGCYGEDESVWVPPVMKVVATDDHGVAELMQAIDAFIAWAERTGRRKQRNRERAYAQMMRALTALLLEPYARTPGSETLPAAVAPWIDRIADGAASPIEAARALLAGRAPKQDAAGAGACPRGPRH
jgi:LAO/AO transport system kinase